MVSPIRFGFGNMFGAVSTFPAASDLERLHNKLSVLGERESTRIGDFIFNEYELTSGITLKEFGLAILYGPGLRMVERFDLAPNIQSVDTQFPFVERLLATHETILDNIGLNQLRLAGTVYANITQAPIWFALAGDDAFLGRALSSIEDNDDSWSIIAHRLDYLDYTFPGRLNSFQFQIQESIFFEIGDGQFIKMTSAQYNSISSCSPDTLLAIADQTSQGVEIKFVTDCVLKEVLRSREREGRELPLIACDRAMGQRARELGSILMTTLLLLQVGQIRSLTPEQFTILSQHLPKGCYRLASRRQLQGLNFAQFAPDRLEALIRGNGSPNEFIARLSVLNPEQKRHLALFGTDWIKSNLPPDFAPLPSMDTLTASFLQLRV